MAPKGKAELKESATMSSRRGISKKAEAAAKNNRYGGLLDSSSSEDEGSDGDTSS